MYPFIKGVTTCIFILIFKDDDDIQWTIMVALIPVVLYLKKRAE